MPTEKTALGFTEAVAAFKAVADKYVHFGARDTEPRAEFAQIIKDLVEGKEPQIPTNARGWQLFSDKKGSFFAAKSLLHAAEKVVTAANADHRAVVDYAKAQGWAR